MKGKKDYVIEQLRALNIHEDKPYELMEYRELKYLLAVKRLIISSSNSMKI